MTNDDNEIRRLAHKAIGRECLYGNHLATCDRIAYAIRTALAAEREQHARDVAEPRADALAMDTPWPVVSMLNVLANAADHLLGAHNCDDHGHEETAAARDAARAHMLRLEARAQALNDSRPPSGTNQGSGAVEAFRDAIERMAAEQLRVISANRERYVAAWIAETGLPPSECVLVEQRASDGSVTMQIRKRKAPPPSPASPTGTPCTGAEFLTAMQAVITPRTDDEIREEIATIEGREDSPTGATRDERRNCACGSWTCEACQWVAGYPRELTLLGRRADYAPASAPGGAPGAETACGTRFPEAVEPSLRPDDERAALLPRLEVLADKLCRTTPYILGSLRDSGLTVVMLACTTPTPSTETPAGGKTFDQTLAEAEAALGVLGKGKFSKTPTGGR